MLQEYKNICIFAADIHNRLGEMPHAKQID